MNIEGDVDDDALVGAVQALAKFHESLRGHFSLDGRRFIIEPQIVVPVAKHDLSRSCV